MTKRAEKREDSRTFSFRMPGDAYDDLAVSAPGWDRSAPHQGAAFVILGSATGPAIAPVVTLEGGQSEAGLGYCARLMFDVDSDGFGDLAVGAPGYSGNVEGAGRLSIAYGQDIDPQQISPVTIKRAEIPLSIPAHAIFVTEDTKKRKEYKTQRNLQKR